MEYPCPTCKTLVDFTKNSFKPFCSDRCRLIDLGAWADESYKISKPTADSIDDEESDPNQDFYL